MYYYYSYVQLLTLLIILYHLSHLKSRNRPNHLIRQNHIYFASLILVVTNQVLLYYNYPF
nr:MAG TPA: hypothetical protein [Caudoviricetes sp.]